jgi:hypothetical protein
MIVDIVRAGFPPALDQVAALRVANARLRQRRRSGRKPGPPKGQPGRATLEMTDHLAAAQEKILRASWTCRQRMCTRR